MATKVKAAVPEFITIEQIVPVDGQIPIHIYGDGSWSYADHSFHTYNEPEVFYVDADITPEDMQNGIKRILASRGITLAPKLLEGEK